MPSTPNEVGLNSRAPCRHRAALALGVFGLGAGVLAGPSTAAQRWPLALSMGPASGDATSLTRPLENTCSSILSACLCSPCSRSKARAAKLSCGQETSPPGYSAPQEQHHGENCRLAAAGMLTRDRLSQRASWEQSRDLGKPDRCKVSPNPGAGGGR